MKILTSLLSHKDNFQENKLFFPWLFVMKPKKAEAEALESCVPSDLEDLI